MQERKVETLVIGAGPGGYVAAVGIGGGTGDLKCGLTGFHAE